MMLVPAAARCPAREIVGVIGEQQRAEIAIVERRDQTGA
jgi:hypothetical protein